MTEHLPGCDVRGMNWICAPGCPAGAPGAQAWDDPAGRIRELEAELHRLRGQLVAVTALADKWESWSTTRSTVRIDAFRDASEELRAVLAKVATG